MASLYALLCGPILRRTETGRVCIWLATSIQPEQIEVLLFPLRHQTGGKGWEAEPAVLPNTTYNVQQLGARLYIVLLEVRPATGSAPFQPLIPYGYDLCFKFRKEDKVILNERDNASKEGGAKEFYFAETFNAKQDYSYRDLPYPVFVIPDPDASNARILYGSCRKIHGPGSDALNAADKLLEDEWAACASNPKHRIPDYCNFMLGDQIYADDLIVEVFNAVRKLADALMGYDETIPEFEGAKEIATADLSTFLRNYWDGFPGYDINNLNMPANIDYVESSSPNNRLINIVKFFNAYFPYPIVQVAVVKDILNDVRQDLINSLSIIYNKDRYPLIDVNEVLPREYMRWKLPFGAREVKGIGFKERRCFVRRNATVSTVDQGHVLTFGEFASLYLLTWGRFPFIEQGSPEYSKLTHLGYKHGKIGYDDNKSNLEGVIEGNRRVRRLLANVPSYMIFDDHEITDEWDYDEVWRNAVEKKSVTGRRMIANGLAAYWAFQAWGNNPDAFSSSFITSIKAFLLEPLEKKGKPDPKKSKDFEDAILGFDDWAFIAPTNPVSVFMDNRTMRGALEKMDYYPALNDNKGYKAARLMNKAAYGKITELLRDSTYKVGSTIVFCAPTPILGSKLFEQGQLDMVDQTFNMSKLLAQHFPRPTGRWDNDFESWGANPRSRYDFFDFMDTVVQPSNVIILSGDVHYGFHAAAQISSALTGRSYYVEQLTSSALKNSTQEKIATLDILSYLSIGGTHQDKYKQFDHLYPIPNSMTASGYEVPGYYVTARLVRYSSAMVDKDTWLIFWNNMGLLEISQIKGRTTFSNYFLWSPYFLAPLSKSFRVWPFSPW